MDVLEYPFANLEQMFCIQDLYTHVDQNGMIHQFDGQWMEVVEAGLVEEKFGCHKVSDGGIIAHHQLWRVTPRFT